MRNRNLGVFESLESRRLLSSAALGADGVLRIIGDDLKTNAITVSNSVDGLSVDVTINSTNSLGVTKTFSRSFLKSQGITSLWVSGGSKNDAITASAVHGAFTIPMRADGRGGNDAITTGDGADLVFAGAGNDLVNSGNGADRVFGGLGDDALNSGGGDDRVSGGWGNDSIDLGSGNDFGRGDAGNDHMEGANGDDVMYGCAGNDELLGERDNDTLFGCAGNDILMGGDDNDTLYGVLGANALQGEGGIDTFVVVRLTLQPNNDYVSTEDLLQLVTGTAAFSAVPPTCCSRSSVET